MWKRVEFTFDIRISLISKARSFTSALEKSVVTDRCPILVEVVAAGVEESPLHAAFVRLER